MSDFLKTSEIQIANFASFDTAAMHASLTEGNNTATQFIHIGGPSAVGKTTLSHILQAELPHSKLLSIDSYLIERLHEIGPTLSNEPEDPSRPFIGGITPKVWEFSLLREHIARLKARLPVQVPVFDQTIKDRTGYTTFEPADQIILEGGNSFGDDLRDHADYKILVKAPLHDRLLRKAVRTHARYRRDDLDEIWGRYLTKDEPSWTAYETEFTEIADQVFHNPANPERDYAQLPAARYEQAEGVQITLTPLPATGRLHPGESLQVVELPHQEYQLSYSVHGRQLVNLPLDKENVGLLEQHYDFTTTREEN